MTIMRSEGLFAESKEPLWDQDWSWWGWFWFSQDRCPGKSQSASKIGYFQSVSNTPWKSWDIHKVLAVTFHLEEQFECSMKCFSLVMQWWEHWPRVGDIDLPLSPSLNGTNSHLPQLQETPSGTAWGRLNPPFLIMLLPGRAWKSLRSMDLKYREEARLCSLIAGKFTWKNNRVYLQNKNKN